MSNYYSYPLQITEIPHRGESRTWVLYDENHLNQCIDFIESRGVDYQAWCSDNGYFEYSYNDETGEFVTKKDESRTLDVYLDWLGHDLRALNVEELA